MNTCGSYKSLEIYQLAHALGVRIHHFTLNLPKYEMYECGSQLRRASKSISANIVEGYGRRRYKAEFIRFLIYAQASCDESIEWLCYIRDCHEQLADESTLLLQQAGEVGRKLNRFIQAVESSHQPSKQIPVSSIKHPVSIFNL
ncbi:MAG: four helix bundle protein [Abitibacteriaceae bacterium]|nr:four helix bundle protein [Abditibacteriaceae bacterium]